eukprot:TRINITY_DN6460_c0_g1_i1.p2 TRINITY_DN6460_c0_g1~~TRINITY_DN6460_c0_g1_i1.p2  ORF type:complete len:113 (+),score=3.10 TRINITY_DN6460_c0_g1_i1:224-562(+)
MRPSRSHPREISAAPQPGHPATVDVLGPSLALVLTEAAPPSRAADGDSESDISTPSAVATCHDSVVALAVVVRIAAVIHTDSSPCCAHLLATTPTQLCGGHVVPQPPSADLK